MENDISHSDFFDYPIISLQEPENILEKCEGSNQKKLLVVFDAADETPERRKFLKKILGAAKFQMEEDILLLRVTPKEPFSFISMRTKAASRFGDIENLLVFGFEPTHFGLNLEVQKYQPFQFYQCGFLFADGLSVLENDKGQKGGLKDSLWKGMQKMFLKDS